LRVRPVGELAGVPAEDQAGVVLDLLVEVRVDDDELHFGAR
jgi:hypothetical protein